MTKFSDTLKHVARKYNRFPAEAYEFVFTGLDEALTEVDDDGQEKRVRRHLRGEELVQGIIRASVKKFGLMAETVFQEWGIKSTDDFGAMVFHMVDEGLIAKTEDDSPADFADLFDVYGAIQECRQLIMSNA